MNVVSLDEFDSERQFEAHFRSLPRVVLEGNSDVQFFAAWFQHLMSELDFIASEAICGTGGCTGVADAVRKSREEDMVPAIGIIDRDWLQREKCWDLLFSMEDDALDSAPEDEDVYTASLWEIEAYLIRPELLSRWVALQRNPPPATVQEKNSALARVLEECEALLAAAPFFASAHAVGQACAPKHFSQVPHHGIAQACATVRNDLSGDQLAVWNIVESLVEIIRENAPADPAEHVLYLLRYVDTKRLLDRIGQRLGLHSNAHHALSELMSMSDLRPGELERMLEDAAERFAA